MATRKKKAAEPVEELDDLEVEDEDLELEELEEADEETEARPRRKNKKASTAPEFGIQELCALVSEETDKEYKPRDLRTLLRKMARDNSGRIDREVTADNRTRYSWSGPEDPEVQAVIAAITGGELEAEKKAALEKLKASQAAKKAAKKAESDDDFDED